MSPFLHRRTVRFFATMALLASIVLAGAHPAVADDWGRDRAAVAAYQGLDPAIRAAVEARAPVPIAMPTATVSVPSADNGFAWGAAAVGFGVAIAGMCLALACVTLVRHDGRLRSA